MRDGVGTVSVLRAYVMFRVYRIEWLVRSRGLLVCSPKVYGFMDWTVTVTVASFTGLFFLMSSHTQGELFLKYTTRFETHFTWLAAASTIYLHLHLLIPDKTSARVRQGIQLKKKTKKNDLTGHYCCQLRHLRVCVSVCLSVPVSVCLSVSVSVLGLHGSELVLVLLRRKK